MREVSTISLIGMPGVGKSTVGVVLAKYAGLGFADSDLEIQSREGATLQAILDSRGFMALRAIEEEVLMALELEGRVIATGGSAVYSAAVMHHLAAAGPVVYLQADEALLKRRVVAGGPRGIASSPADSFATIFAERTPLYERYSDFSVGAAGVTAEEIAARILQEVGS